MKTENKFLTYFLGICLGAQALFLLWVFVFHYMCMDHAEHLHAAWLVWQGQIPYRDFFEHHNPLLWYLLAPLTAAFYQNALVLYAGRVVAFAGYVFMFSGVYRLCRDFMAIPKAVFWLALVLFFVPYDNYYLMFELQPDALMWGCFFYGLHAYFRFIHDGQAGKSRDIRNAYILFVLSFLFLQKILLLLAMLGVYTLYLMKKKQINGAAVCKTLGWPAGMGMAFLLYLHYTGCWDLYFIYNYELNAWMQDFMGEARILKNWIVVALLPGAAVLLLHHFLAKRNPYREIFCTLMFGEFIVKMMFGSPYVQYFLFSNLASALIIADFAVRNIGRMLIKAALVLTIMAEVVLLCLEPPNTQYPRYFIVHNYIMRNARPGEPIINPVYFFFNIYGRNPSYYWFGYGNIAQVAHYLYGVDEGFDLNKAIRDNMPKFVYLVQYTNLMSNANKDDLTSYWKGLAKMWEKMPEPKEDEETFVKRWLQPYFEVPDVDFLNRYYRMSPFSPLIIRKDLPETETPTKMLDFFKTKE